jgi:flagellar motor switch protein FliN/FliY
MTENKNNRSLDFLMDVPLKVTVELGRKRMRVAELLALAKGTVVELEKVAGEPLDVLVNDQLVARGEAVVINDKFGVRLTDVVNEQERMSGLT